MGRAIVCIGAANSPSYVQQRSDTSFEISQTLLETTYSLTEKTWTRPYWKQPIDLLKKPGQTLLETTYRLTEKSWTRPWKQLIDLLKKLGPDLIGNNL